MQELSCGYLHTVKPLNIFETPSGFGEEILRPPTLVKDLFIIDSYRGRKGHTLLEMWTLCYVSMDDPIPMHMKAVLNWFRELEGKLGKGLSGGLDQDAAHTIHNSQMTNK